MHRLPSLISFRDLLHFDLPIGNRQLVGLVDLVSLKIPVLDGFMVTPKAFDDCINMQVSDEPKLWVTSQFDHLWLGMYHTHIGRHSALIQSLDYSKLYEYASGEAVAHRQLVLYWQKLVDKLVLPNLANAWVAVYPIPDQTISGTITTHSHKDLFEISSRFGLPQSTPEDIITVSKKTGEVVKQVIGHQSQLYELNHRTELVAKKIDKSHRHQPKITPQILQQLGIYGRLLCQRSPLSQQYSWYQIDSSSVAFGV